MDKIYIPVAALILLDILTGLMKAVYKEGINSTVLRKGLFHKLSEIVTVAGCGLADYMTTYIDFGFEIHILKPVAIYICIMELISIIENIGEVNEPLKKFFAPYLDKLKGEADEHENERD